MSPPLTAHPVPPNPTSPSSATLPTSPSKPGETELNPVYAPNQFTPPTFLIQAENDKGYGHNALVYYRALMDAKIPAELHYFATRRPRLRC